MAKKTKNPSVPSEPESVYQLKVTLDEIRPLIWRRIQVRGDISLFKLHKILQEVMGWQDYHLHRFEIEGESYSVISREADMLGDDFIDEKKVRLNRVIPGEKFKFAYEYDFGDSWYHTILVEKIFQPKEELKAPICLKGKRSAPQEDCGGTGGYTHVLRAFRNPKHPDHEDIMNWLEEGYDPEHFNVDEVNERLMKIR
jgi:hypothetical protein